VGRNYCCFSLRPPSWHPQERSRGRSRLPLFFPLFLSLVRILFFVITKPGRGAKGSLQRVAIVRIGSVTKCAAVV